MKRLRSLNFRHWVLPVVLAALAARAFMPAGFMAMSAGHAVTISMCSQDKTRRERLEIPGDPVQGQHRAIECKHCLSPILGTPFAFVGVESSPVAPLIPNDAQPQLASSPLLRAQSARAPPHA